MDMSITPDAYYHKRYTDELLAADRALSPEASKRHQELAALYLLKLTSSKPKGRRKGAA
jgi:hypothetical protein